MIIGVISDTHGSLPSAVCEVFRTAGAQGAGVSHIIHAGDIGSQRILDKLELIAPVTAVLGNCDYPEYYALKEGKVVDVCASEMLELAGRRIFITHKPDGINQALFAFGPNPAMNPLPHICIHGHTHVPKDEMRGVIRILCPGSPVNPRGGSKASVLLLELDEAASPSEAKVEVIAVR